jgi:hypothetical protein
MRASVDQIATVIQDLQCWIGRHISYKKRRESLTITLDTTGGPEGLRVISTNSANLRNRGRLQRYLKDLRNLRTPCFSIVKCGMSLASMRRQRRSMRRQRRSMRRQRRSMTWRCRSTAVGGIPAGKLDLTVGYDRNPYVSGILTNSSCN